MKTWMQVNFGTVVVQLVGAVVIGGICLWFRAALARELECYVTEKDLGSRIASIDMRIDKLEKVVCDGRIERLAFQRDVIDRLARIETRLSVSAWQSTNAFAKGTP